MTPQKKYPQNGFVLLPLLILLSLLTLETTYIIKSLYFQTQQLKETLKSTTLHYHALSCLPYLNTYINQIPTFNHPLTKTNLYTYKGLNLPIPVSSTLYLTKTETTLYCIAFEKEGPNTPRTIIAFPYTYAPPTLTIQGWEPF